MDQDVHSYDQAWVGGLLAARGPTLQTFDKLSAKIVEEVERFNLDPEIAVFDFLLKRHTF